MLSNEAYKDACDFWDANEDFSELLLELSRHAAEGEFFKSVSVRRFDQITGRKVSAGIIYLRSLGYYARREESDAGDTVVSIGWSKMKGGMNA